MALEAEQARRAEGAAVAFAFTAQLVMLQGLQLCLRRGLGAADVLGFGDVLEGLGGAL